jgi:probable rRNA maturation factor
MPHAAPLTVELLDATRQLSRDDLHFIIKHVGDAGALLRVAGNLRVRVVDDEEMSRAHEEFSGVPGTTDVLTFDMLSPEDIERFGEDPAIWQQQPVPGTDRELWGHVEAQRLVETDILICRDEALRQASQRGYDCRKELLLYVIHGLMHCLGHDDHEEEDSALMHRVEDAILEAIGVGPVYRDR